MASSPEMSPCPHNEALEAEIARLPLSASASSGALARAIWDTCSQVFPPRASRASRGLSDAGQGLWRALGRDQAAPALIVSWDTAMNAGELSDYSACVVLQVRGEAAYVLDVVRERLDFPDLRR